MFTFDMEIISVCVVLASSVGFGAAVGDHCGFHKTCLWSLSPCFISDPSFMFISKRKELFPCAFAPTVVNILSSRTISVSVINRTSFPTLFSLVFGITTESGIIIWWHIFGNITTHCISLLSHIIQVACRRTPIPFLDAFVEVVPRFCSAATDRHIARGR